jgi:hypothetical protein
MIPLQEEDSERVARCAAARISADRVLNLFI